MGNGEWESEHEVSKREDDIGCQSPSLYLFATSFDKVASSLFAPDRENHKHWVVS